MTGGQTSRGDGAREHESLLSSSRPRTAIGVAPSACAHPDCILPCHIRPENKTNDDVSGSQAPLLQRTPPTGPEPPSPQRSNKGSRVQSWRRKLWQSWLMSKGMLMVMLAQFFGASMNVMTRTLQLDGSHGKGMHPFQILFARMGITVLLSLLYMLYARVPHPFGIRSIRPLLFLRGISGFFGVFGLYSSLLHLALSEATVLTFLAPIGCCYVCSLTMPNETFTRRQQVAALASLLGVVLIARPASLFRGSSHVSASSSSWSSTDVEASPAGSADDAYYKRTLGILAALLGVVGATAAYTSIRVIGKRAHPLVSVTYFSGLTTIISLLAVALIPGISFRLPGNMAELLLLLGLGACGFLLQFLLTAGLSYVPPASATGDGEKEVGGFLGVGAGAGVDIAADVEQEGTVGGQVGEVVSDERVRGGGGRRRDEEVKKEDIAKPSTHGSKATTMVYTQMLFAVLYDKVVFNATLSPVSLAGSMIILASAMYVALVKERRKDVGSGAGADEYAVVEGQGVGGENGDGDGDGEGSWVSRQQSRHAQSWNIEDARLAEAGEGTGLLAGYVDDDDDDDDDYDYYDYDCNSESGNDNGDDG
ncbi:conserved hypothetical protein [Histoplasma capsulatum G186AR]|uniref:EamA domain-containing protein n=1 Tax=Ajellomyces capsulatus (strain G186AR / H82 / ATCC MYA-2454 / RMSCC 2432) TaxID=447093 RepID=C0NQU5_AJECG|nr:uncharacterized protein HCBG_05375 [Histoplasma capsulatum G186AR]EEH06059.1 conserved hypothetical protein [Histoplasma capsulatum G186AR]